MTRVYLGIGSNIDREKNIRGAVHELKAHYGPLTSSPVYESRAHGFKGENFYNLVVGFDCGETLERLRETLLQIEIRFGRTRVSDRFSSRTLDLDLLLYGDTVRHDDDVDLPHPDITRYPFVLRPLAEIAPSLHHPETKQTYAQMWKKMHDHRHRLTIVKMTL